MLTFIVGRRIPSSQSSIIWCYHEEVDLTLADGLSSTPA